MFAVGMKKELQPFCYQHLTEMMHLTEMILYENELLKAKTGTAYVCSELNCPVTYHTLDGYFIASNEGDRIEQSTTPNIPCPNDGMPMYLAEIHPEHKSYRLWKCPQCGKRITNLQSMQAAGITSKPPQKTEEDS